MAFSNYINLLENLKKNTKSLWGKMTPQHMVEHLILAVQSSNGKLSIEELMTPPEKLDIMKRFLMSSRALPQNFVNTVIGEGLKSLIYKDLETAKLKLNEELEDFEKYFQENPESRPTNATFGPLNKEEWIQFHTKHFTHHLKQVGLIKE